MELKCPNDPKYAFIKPFKESFLVIFYKVWSIINLIESLNLQFQWWISCQNWLRFTGSSITKCKKYFADFSPFKCNINPFFDIFVHKTFAHFILHTFWCILMHIDAFWALRKKSVIFNQKKIKFLNLKKSIVFHSQHQNHSLEMHYFIIHYKKFVSVLNVSKCLHNELC